MSKWGLELGQVFENGHCLDLMGVLRGDDWNQGQRAWGRGIGIGVRY